jgi:EAL domain-containing protein (putative c-di-GMP-specific phosphodiesterase class I)
MRQRECHVVGVKVVAEGVEHVDQYLALVGMGCDYVQGYYYATTMEPTDVARILATAMTVPSEVRRAEFVRASR